MESLMLFYLYVHYADDFATEESLQVQFNNE